MTEPNFIHLTPIEMVTPAYGGGMFLYDGPYQGAEIIVVEKVRGEAGYYRLALLQGGNRYELMVPGDQKLRVEDRPFEGL